MGRLNRDFLLKGFISSPEPLVILYEAKCHFRRKPKMTFCLNVKFEIWTENFKIDLLTFEQPT